MNYFSLFIFTCCSFYFQAQNAVKYMNNISKEASYVREASWEYTNSVLKNKSATKVEDNRMQLIITIEKTIERVNKMGDFKGKSYYKDSILHFLKVYSDVMVYDYQKIVNIERKAKNEFDLRDQYIIAKEEANTKMTEASEMIDEVEKQFAAEFKVKLIFKKSKVAEKLKKSNRIFKYYNSIFLAYYSSYSEETHFLEALEKGDIAGMEAAKAKFTSNTRENFAKMNLKLDFDGDNSLLNSAQALLNFYQIEAQEDFQKIIDFQKFKADYLKTKATLEAKPSSERAKGEVANFNKLVAEYNQKMEVYNTLILNQNAKREALITDWNTIGEAFEKKHLN